MLDLQKMLPRRRRRAGPRDQARSAPGGGPSRNLDPGSQEAWFERWPRVKFRAASGGCRLPSRREALEGPASPNDPAPMSGRIVGRDADASGRTLEGSFSQKLGARRSEWVGENVPTIGIANPTAITNADAPKTKACSGDPPRRDQIAVPSIIPRPASRSPPEASLLAITPGQRKRCASACAMRSGVMPCRRRVREPLVASSRDVRASDQAAKPRPTAPQPPKMAAPLPLCLHDPRVRTEADVDATHPTERERLEWRSDRALSAPWRKQRVHAHHVVARDAVHRRRLARLLRAIPIEAPPARTAARRAPEDVARAS